MSRNMANRIRWLNYVFFSVKVNIRRTGYTRYTAVFPGQSLPEIIDGKRCWLYNPIFVYTATELEKSLRCCPSPSTSLCWTLQNWTAGKRPVLICEMDFSCSRGWTVINKWHRSETITITRTDWLRSKLVTITVLIWADLYVYASRRITVR